MKHTTHELGSDVALLKGALKGAIVEGESESMTKRGRKTHDAAAPKQKHQQQQKRNLGLTS